MRTSYLTIMTYVRSRIVNNTNFYKLFSDSLGEKTCCMRSDNLTTKRRSVQQLPIFMNEWMLDYKPTWVTRFLSNSCWDSVYFFIVCIFFFCQEMQKEILLKPPKRLLKQPDLLRKQRLSHKIWVFHNGFNV